jgi:signal transduction histidine kinase
MGEQVGAIVYATSRSNPPPSPMFLGRLAAHAAVAFTNAALGDDLERRSSRLELEVRERTRVISRALTNLGAAQASLVQAERQSALGVLVAGVSHEINNALNFIYGNLPVLARYVETYEELYRRAVDLGAAAAADVEPARAAVGRLLAATDSIGDAARRARAIVDDLRRFARHDEAERKRVDVRDGMTSTLNLLAAEMRGRVEVDRRWDARGEAVLLDCFPAALNHVFLNVLLNAAQAIDDKGKIAIELEQAAGVTVRVVITDDGRGVAASDLPRVFEPFFTTRRRAAGLGLAVSRQIVERHGGTIALQQNPTGQGTQVTITLPTAQGI